MQWMGSGRVVTEGVFHRQSLKLTQDYHGLTYVYAGSYYGHNRRESVEQPIRPRCARPPSQTWEGFNGNDLCA